MTVAQKTLQTIRLCVQDTQSPVGNVYFQSEAFIHTYGALPTAVLLKLVSAIFYQIFVFPQNDSPSKTMKSFLFHQKSSLCSQDIQTFVIFPLPFCNFQIQKDKLKWNNL